MIDASQAGILDEHAKALQNLLHRLSRLQECPYQSAICRECIAKSKIDFYGIVTHHPSQSI